MSKRLGTCCSCGRDKPDVRNVVMLPYVAKNPGTGWGCAQCGLPNDGALAVVCDHCLRESMVVRWEIDGYAERKQRSEVPKVPREAFQHRLEFHTELVGIPRSKLGQPQ